MNILITSSRAPVALELIRQLGRAGHTIVATDTRSVTLASHSRWLAGHVVTPPPRQATAAFLATLGGVIERQRIDLVVPTCEEVFYLAQGLDELQQLAAIFTSPLPVLTELHHKFAFMQRAAALGLRTPRTALISDAADLARRLPEFPRFLLKPAYSRFATHIVTNCGPLAGRWPLGSCQPTPARPWVLQEFVVGQSVCSYSLVHAGRVTAHCAYSTPFAVGGGAGVQFCAVAGATTRAIAERISAALGYTGQLSLDFLEADDGLYLLECNPRATSGAHLLTPAELVGGLLDGERRPWT